MSQLDDGAQLQTLSSRRDERGLHHPPTIEGLEENENVPELVPIDRGRAAWRMLLSAFIFESLLWGKWTKLLSRSLLFVPFQYIPSLS